METVYGIQQPKKVLEVEKTGSVDCGGQFCNTDGASKLLSTAVLKSHVRYTDVMTTNSSLPFEDAAT